MARHANDEIRRCEIPLAVGQDDEFERVIALHTYLLSLTQDQRVHIDVARLAVRWVQERQTMPLITDISELVYAQKNCFCTDTISRSSILRVLSIMLGWQLTMWPCNYIVLACQLEASLGHLTIEDMYRVIATQNDVLNGNAADVQKTVRPVDLSNAVHIHGTTAMDICAICCNSMTDFTLDKTAERPRHVRKHYKLRCGHKFHFHEVYCLPGTILEWFKSHSICPLCRQEV